MTRKTQDIANIITSFAVQMNNEAVLLLEENKGNYKRAIALLTKALQKSKEGMQVRDHLSENDDDMSCETSLASTIQSCMDQRQPYTNEDTAESERDQESRDFIYRKGVYIPMTSQLASNQFCLMLTLIIVFNLALAHHLASADETIDSKETINNLVKAARLYRLAHRLHTDENVCSPIYAIACVNNLGIVSKNLNDIDTYKSCFDHILSTIMFMVARGEQDEIGNDIYGFFQNAMNNQRSIVRTAPAA
jgi:hypothetical protein